MNTLQAYISRSLFPDESDKSTLLERALSVVIFLAIALMVLHTEPYIQFHLKYWVQPIVFIFF